MMKKIDRFNTGRPAAGIVLGFIFTVMLVLNFLTPYIADDYVYMFAFDTKLRRNIFYLYFVHNAIHRLA